ncbi:MAG: hypothetical protein PHE49_10580, partial [bacterium]|nr:hypothetical protein [bacterium]
MKYWKNHVVLFIFLGFIFIPKIGLAEDPGVFEIGDPVFRAWALVGHAGALLYKDPSTNKTLTIESCKKEGKVKGVHYKDFDIFCTDAHYWGRKHSPTTFSQRQNMITFLYDKIGYGYASTFGYKDGTRWVPWSLTKVTYRTYRCDGLIEHAHEAVGSNIVHDPDFYGLFAFMQYGILDGITETNTKPPAVSEVHFLDKNNNEIDVDFFGYRACYIFINEEIKVQGKVEDLEGSGVAKVSIDCHYFSPRIIYDNSFLSEIPPNHVNVKTIESPFFSVSTPTPVGFAYNIVWTTYDWGGNTGDVINAAIFAKDPKPENISFDVAGTYLTINWTNNIWEERKNDCTFELYRKEGGADGGVPPTGYVLVSDNISGNATSYKEEECSLTPNTKYWYTFKVHYGSNYTSDFSTPVSVVTKSFLWIANPDFEEQLKGWTSYGTGNTYEASTSAHDGTYSAHIGRTAGTDYFGLYQKCIPCETNTTYWLALWMKTENVTSGAAKAAFGVWSPEHHTDFPEAGISTNTDWTYYYAPWTSNSTEDRLQVTLYGDQNFIGDAYFDNIHLVKDETPPEVTVVWPNGEEYLVIGENYNLKVSGSDDVAVESLRVYLWQEATDLPGTYITSIYPRLPQGEWEINYNVPSSLIPADNYKISVVAYDPSGHTASDVSDDFFSIVKGTEYRGADWTWTIDSTRKVAGGHYNIGKFTINGNAIMNIKPWDGTDYGDIIIHAQEMDILGILNADTVGCFAESGWGAGIRGSVSHGASGAGYGGRGGHGGNNIQGDTTQHGGYAYGNIIEPLMMGSGGGNSDPTLWGKGGSGGGIVRLICLGTANVTGTVRSNGRAGLGDDGKVGGGGSGGSVWIKTNSLEGTGIISAKGGNGAHDPSPGYTDGGGGAGGRIYVKYINSDFTGRIDVSGGEGPYNAIDGQFGTVLLQQADDAVKLVLSPVNTGTNSDSKAGFIKGVEFTNSWVRLTANDSIVGNIGVRASDSIIVHSNGRIIADNKGYGHNQGTGYGHAGSPSHGGGGAGYGNTGGHGNYYTQGGIGDGGVYYGDEWMPDSLGSGGGDYSATTGYCWGGGTGGGRIRLDCIEGKILINGTLSAKGANGISKSGYAAGGGAGGSILLYTDYLTGNGTINANGGDGGYVS